MASSSPARDRTPVPTARKPARYRLGQGALGIGMAPAHGQRLGQRADESGGRGGNEEGVERPADAERADGAGARQSGAGGSKPPGPGVGAPRRMVNTGRGIRARCCIPGGPAIHSVLWLR